MRSPASATVTLSQSPALPENREEGRTLTSSSSLHPEPSDQIPVLYLTFLQSRSSRLTLKWCLFRWRRNAASNQQPQAPVCHKPTCSPCPSQPHILILVHGEEGLCLQGSQEAEAKAQEQGLHLQSVCTQVPSGSPGRLRRLCWGLNQLPFILLSPGSSGNLARSRDLSLPDHSPWPDLQWSR